MAALGLALGGSPVFIVAGDDLPGKVVHSWLANSFATEQGHQSVPVNVCGIGVTPDGTVYSAGVSEGYGGVASYKDGKFVTKYDYDSGFGSSSSAVVADDEVRLHRHRGGPVPHAPRGHGLQQNGDPEEAISRASRSATASCT